MLRRSLSLFLSFHLSLSATHSHLHAHSRPPGPPSSLIPPSSSLNTHALSLSTSLFDPSHSAPPPPPAPQPLLAYYPVTFLLQDNINLINVSAHCPSKKSRPTLANQRVPEWKTVMFGVKSKITMARQSTMEPHKQFNEIERYSKSPSSVGILPLRPWFSRPSVGLSTLGPSSTDLSTSLFMDPTR